MDRMSVVDFDQPSICCDTYNLGTWLCGFKALLVVSVNGLPSVGSNRLKRELCRCDGLALWVEHGHAGGFVPWLEHAKLEI